jgi:hypothetical protein
MDPGLPRTLLRPPPPLPPRTAPVAVRPRGPSPIPVGWKHLALGLGLSLLFTVTPTLRFMGWLLGSLFHETGHVAFAWFVGCPAFPAISLEGHAAAFHQDPHATVRLAVAAGLVFAAWGSLATGRWRGLAFGLLFAWPFLAFARPLREIGFLLSGHLGELVFAGVFLWRARTGGHVEREAERPLYACVGWFLIGRNAVLSFGLAFVPAARAAYHGNGSFGLANDYVRVAAEWLHVPLAAVGGFMLLVSLAVFPLVLAATASANGGGARGAPARTR